MEYDQAANNWTQRANFAGTSRFHAVAFSISNKGYIGTGLGGANLNDFWEYYPGIISTNTLPTYFCAGSNISVSFSTPDNFNSGNIFTCQLSDGAGSFSLPTVIGS